MTTDSTITPELLDQLLANYEKPEDLTGENGLFKQLKKALIERALRSGTEPNIWVMRRAEIRPGRGQRQQPQRDEFKER